MRGENNANWRGGKRLDRKGYVTVRMPEHPHAFGGYVYEHTLVAEQMLGRPIRKGEDVHHIDGVTSNNDPANLLVLTKSDHTKLHAELRGN